MDFSGQKRSKSQPTNKPYMALFSLEMLDSWVGAIIGRTPGQLLGNYDE